MGCCCGNIGIILSPPPPIFTGGYHCGGWTPGCFGWGFSRECCDPFSIKPFLFGAGEGVGYAGTNFLLAGIQKLLSRKNNA